MLGSIDILIGLSLVMLVASLATMLVTQSLIALFRRRGAHLLTGLTDLLSQLDPSTISEPDAKHIAETLLKHPLVRGSKSRSATVIKREELLTLLLKLAIPPAANTSPGTLRLDETIRGKLETLLQRNGIADPGKTLSTVRMLALELERSHPELATAARQTLALTQEAHSEFVANVNAWFDQTMDRVTERFTVSTRALTLAGAVALVLVTQLDTVAVINRLAMDEPMRRAFVEQAVRVDAQARGAGAQPGIPDEDQQRLMRVMGDAGLLRVPKDFPTWRSGWATVNPLGVLLSVLLLSLGAPFWFSALNRLLRLRSVVAQKDDVDRAERQLDTSRPLVDGASRASVGGGDALPSGAAGERGDLAAVG